MIFKKIAFALAMCIGMSSAMADIQISDTYIDFKGNSDFSVSLVNTGLSIDSYSLGLLTWEQESGSIGQNGKVIPIKNIYNDFKGDDLVVFPNTIVLRPSQNNTVRLRAKGDKSNDKTAYRLVIKEIDKKYPGNRVSSNQINIRLSHRIPVFMNNNVKNIKDIDAQYNIVSAHNKKYLHIKNNDKESLFINGVSQDTLDNAIGYILPGIETYFDLTDYDLNKPIILRDKNNKKELDFSKKNNETK